jgi:hypothetical protein
MNYSFFDNNKDGKADYKDAFSFVKNVFSSKHSDKNNYMPNSYRHPNNYQNYIPYQNYHGYSSYQAYPSNVTFQAQWPSYFNSNKGYRD